MSSTVFLARLIGLLTVVAALAILINRRGMLAAVEKVIHNADTLLIVEIGGLAAGLAIVIGHEVWTSVLGVIVTLLGWLMVLRAVVLMLLPPEQIAALFALAAWPQRAETYAMIALAVGAVLTIWSFA